MNGSRHTKCLICEIRDYINIEFVEVNINEKISSIMCGLWSR